MIFSSSLIPSRPCAATMPSSAKCARMALITWVRCRIKRSRARCNINRPCCSVDLICTKRTVGRRAASQIASASAKFREFTRPIMSRGAGFHADKASRQRLEELQHLAAPQLLTNDDLFSRVDAMDLEHVLGDIQTDRGNLHVDSFLM